MNYQEIFKNHYQGEMNFRIEGDKSGIFAIWENERENPLESGGKLQILINEMGISFHFNSWENCFSMGIPDNEIFISPENEKAFFISWISLFNQIELLIRRGRKSRIPFQEKSDFKELKEILLEMGFQYHENFKD